MDWNSLTTVEQFDRVLQLSDQIPVIIFKHSTRCSTSSVALNRIERDCVDVNGNIHFSFIDIISHRFVSNLIAEKLNVEHQSPQLLIIINGKCIYHASHLAISCKEALKNITEFQSA